MASGAAISATSTGAIATCMLDRFILLPASRSSEPKSKIDINNRLTNIENLERMEGIEPTPPVWKLLLNPRATPAKKFYTNFHKDGRDFRVLMASFWNQRKFCVFVGRLKLLWTSFDVR